MRSALLILVLSTTACSSTPLGPDGDGPVAVVRLRSEPYSFSYNSALREPQRLVIRDAASLQQLWATAWSTMSHPPPLPAVDFAREMLVVAAMGERPTGGHSIFVGDAFEDDTGVTVEIRSVSAGAGCGVTLAVTQPIDIARLPRRTGNVTFVELPEMVDCR